MKRFVLIFGFAVAAIGLALTIVVLATMTSESFPFSFDFGMTVIAPTISVGRALGIPDDEQAWLWDSLAVVLNTVLCFAAGTLAGIVAYCVTRQSRKEKIAG